MMTPVYLNPPPSPFPLVEEKEEQHLQLFLSSHQATSSLSGPTFFNTAQDQRVRKLEESNLQHDQKGSIDRHVLSSSSLHLVVDDGKNIHNLSLFKREDGEESRNDNESVKWMSSKVRLMQKMMTSNSTENDRPAKLMHKAHGQQHENYKSNSSINNNNNNSIRVCADCNTTTTPLWRSGPQGPKSLCNACGIRQRKARRAMAATAVAAANGTIIATEASSTKTKLNNKEKKSCTSHVVQHKKQFKPLDSPRSQKKICFKDFALSLNKNSAFQRLFPQDEEEAAILLMGLSCGFIYS